MIQLDPDNFVNAVNQVIAIRNSLQRLNINTSIIEIDLRQRGWKDQLFTHWKILWVKCIMPLSFVDKVTALTKK